MPTIAQTALLPLLVATAAAQIPSDAVVVLEAPQALQDPIYHLVDSFGRGATTMRGQSVFLQPAPVSVAVDPVQPTAFFFQANTSSLPGTWRSDLGPLATIGQSVWGAWLTMGGQRVEAGVSAVFTLRNGLVESSLKSSPAPQTPISLFGLVHASDLAVREPFLYVASFDAQAPALLIEYDLVGGAVRIVGSYQGVHALAASPVGTALLLGTEAGDLLQVDPATGAVTSSTNPQVGPILTVGYTRLGTRLYANDTQLWSDLVPNAPIFVSATQIVDFGVGRAPTASVVPYGQGCGAGGTATWANTGLPTLGNAGFQLGLRLAPANAFALLVLGGSRTVAAALGGVALPFGLGGFGASGCQLLVDPQIVGVLATGVTGNANQAIPVPSTASLAGIEFVGQWLVPDASVGPFGLATTEGVAFVVQ